MRIFFFSLYSFFFILSKICFSSDFAYITNQLSNTVSVIDLEKYEVFTELGSTEDAFLAAQGITIDEAKEIKTQAKENDYSVQHAYSLRRFYKLQKNNL